jgi:hypothetical protein
MGNGGNEPPRAIALSNDPPGRDLFGDLRRWPVNEGADPFEALAQSLRRLHKLEGAHVDVETGSLALFGEQGEGDGPLSLQDLVAALWAEFHDLSGLTVSIDPVEGNPNGPLMNVVFTGGADNTHIGNVMFEADRLLKCLGLGKHNESGEVMQSKVKGYAPLPRLSLILDADGKSSFWTRFWITTSLGKLPKEDSRDKPVLTMANEGRTVWLERVPLFVKTELMVDRGSGRLDSSGGKQDDASAYFAKLVTNEYAQFAEEFPVLAELQELAKLTVLAHWLRTTEAPIAYELLYLRWADPPFATPRTTPTISAEFESAKGSVTIKSTMFGGVNLSSEPFYAKDDQGRAAKLGELYKNRRADAEREGTVIVEDSPASKQITLFPRPIRGPPIGTTSDAPRAKRAARALRLSSGAPSAQGREAAALRGTVELAKSNEPSALENYDLPIWRDPATGEAILNLPLLRVGYDAHHMQTLHVEVGPQIFDVLIPSYLYVTSPLCDIDLQFVLRPEYDSRLSRMYFPCREKGVLGFYPDTSTVRMTNGAEFRFDPATGALASVEGGDLPQLEFKFDGYADGPLVRPQLQTPDKLPRPPPTKDGPPRPSPIIRLSRGAPDAQSRPGGEVILNAEQFAAPQVHVRNRRNGREMDVRRQGTELAFFVR